MTKGKFLSSIAFLLLLQPSAFPCTTFTLEKDGHVVFGRNLDWHVGSGMIIVNPKNVSKKAMIFPKTERPVNPAEWTSNYGSITFNGLARDFPNGGLNEAGLAVDIMWLDSTRYPQADSRPEIDALQWVQYLLDSCQSVDEVLAAQSKVRISEDAFPPQHFLVADRTGKTAAIEFLDGKLVAHVGEALPYRTLTNNAYDESKAYTDLHTGFGGQKLVEPGNKSLDRFVRSAEMLKAYPSFKDNIVDFSFKILHNVNQGYDLKNSATVWSIVYDLTKKKIYYRTYDNRNIRSIDLAKFDFACNKPVSVWTIENDYSGDITDKAKPYSRELNREYIVKHLSNENIVKNYGDFSLMIDPLTVYPEKFTSCNY